MTVTLQLKPEVERRVAAEASARGVSVEEYLTSVIEAEAPARTAEPLSLEEFEAALDLLAEGSEELPILPPEAFTRESIYADHD